MTKNRKPITWPMPCPECGTGKIRPVVRRGRTARHKTLMLEIPSNVQIPTCDNCGTEWIDAQTAAAVDEALEKAFDREASAQARELLVAMTQEVTQHRLETVLGLSHGYLSKVRSGTSTPSAMLLACLRLLSRSPESRIRELEGAVRDLTRKKETNSRQRARHVARPRKAVAGRR